MKRHWHCLLAPVLMTLAVSLASAQTTLFYRVASTGETAIVFLDRSGLLTCTSSVPDMPCVLECARSPEGPWTAGFSHTIVTARTQEMTALVPLRPSTPPPTRPCCSSNLVGRVKDSILLGGILCRVEAFVWRDLMPGPGPASGILANVRVIATGGQAIPSSATITEVWIINGTQVWDVPYPPPAWTSPPSVIETTLRNGPLWSPGTRVDVLMQVTAGSVNYLLRAANETVDAVW